MNRRELLTRLTGATAVVGLGVKSTLRSVTVPMKVTVIPAQASFSMAGGKLFSFREIGVEVYFIDKDGVMHITDMKRNVA